MSKHIIQGAFDTHLYLAVSDVPEDILPHIKEALCLENEEKITAKKELQKGWKDMPDEIDLWSIINTEEDGPVLVMPRGFRWQLEQGLSDFDIEIDWLDFRTGNKLDADLCKPFSQYREHQPPAAEAMLEAEDGIYKAPPGSGKTVTVLEIVRRARFDANLIIVNSIEIAEQWRNRAKQFMGNDFPVGIIGDNTWEESTLTICTQQTLFARMDELDEDGWWDKWGLVCMDECHHQTARTFQLVMQKFRSMMRFGVSATPDKTGPFEYALAVLGDVVHETTRAQLREQGVLVRPIIKIIETEFDYPFHGTFTVSETHDCPLNCSRTGRKHIHRNNYSKMMQNLREDYDRNTLIIDNILEESGNRQLVVSPQTGHLKTLRERLSETDFEDDVYFMTGKETRKKRAEIIAKIEEAPCVVFSTIADEALDVPLLNVIHMTWPTKNAGSVRQRIGRVERAADGKEHATVYDYADVVVPTLLKQFAERRWKVYADDLYRLEYKGEE